MKIKISFDKKAVIHFFVEHIEKVVFALFVLAFAAIIYGAMMKREKFDKTPLQLIDKCNDAERSLTGDRPDQLTTPDYKKIAEKIADLSSKKGINVAPYETELAWDEPVFGVKDKRDQPALFDVLDLRATAEFGAFQVTDTPAAPAAAAPQRPGMRGMPMGGGRAVGSLSTKGRCWVVLTGLVPWEDQLNSYKKTFRNTVAYDPVADVPVYLGYYVERAEINSPADLQNPKWSKKFIWSSTEEEKARQDWAQIQPDVVEDRFTDPMLTYPLGPLTNSTWDKNVAHLPDIPLLAGYNATAEDEASPVDNRPAADGPFRDRDTVAGPGAPPTEVRQAPRMAPGRGAQRGAVDTFAGDPERAVKYKLFRFFDFTAEPGKTYVYRAQLVLKNPNYQLDPARLKNPKFAQDRLLTSGGSQKSNAIFVPKDTQILVDSVNKKSAGDLSAKFYLIKWMKETGQEVYKDFADIERGKILNFNDVKQPKPVVTVAVGPLDATIESANFISDATVLDMDGGKIRIGRDRNLTEPGAVIVMFVQGATPVLMVRDELDDMARIAKITKEPEIAPGRAEYDRRTAPAHAPTEGESRLLEPTPRRPAPATRGG